MATDPDILRNSELIANLTAQVAALTATVETNATENNTFFLLWAGAIVFLMQAGFATLSAGSIRLKNLLDACMGALTWYFIGYGVAYDGDAGANGFIGRGISNFALSGLNDMGPEHLNGNDWISWYI